MGNPQPSSKPKQMGFIYMITSPSGKSYIGQTTRSVDQRIEEHFKCLNSCIILENAIRKYGKEFMRVETLVEVNDDMLDFYEIKFIEGYGTLEPNGYNVRSGGSGGMFSEQSRGRMREAKLGEKNFNYGKPRTEEAKKAISIAKSGEHHHFYGKQFTLEHKKQLAIAHRKSHTELPMYVTCVKSRPEQYTSSGYAVTNHPMLANKYFTSKKLSDDEKLERAMKYLASA